MWFKTTSHCASGSEAHSNPLRPSYLLCEVPCFFPRKYLQATRRLMHNQWRPATAGVRHSIVQYPNNLVLKKDLLRPQTKSQNTALMLIHWHVRHQQDLRKGTCHLWNAPHWSLRSYSQASLCEDSYGCIQGDFAGGVWWYTLYRLWLTLQRLPTASQRHKRIIHLSFKFSLI